MRIGWLAGAAAALIACSGNRHDKPAHGVDLRYVVMVEAGADLDAAQQRAVTAVRARIDGLGLAAAIVPEVRIERDSIRVILAGAGEDDADRVEQALAMPGRLTFRPVIADSPAARRLYDHVTADPDARGRGVRATTDTWSGEDGPPHADWLLVADQRDPLDAYLASLPADLRPDDGQLVVAEDGDRWRTYLLGEVALDGSHVADAHISPDTRLRVDVMLTFDAEGGRLFGELTGRMHGGKLAICLDDRVISAPVIQTKIGGGRAVITMGGQGAKLGEAATLAAVLRGGMLPAPLQLVASQRF